jgi:hypothetical protein
VELERGGVCVRIALPPGIPAELQVLRGSVSPIAGWVSRRFDRKQPCATLVWRARLAGPTELATELGTDHLLVR